MSDAHIRDCTTTGAISPNKLSKSAAGGRLLKQAQPRSRRSDDQTPEDDSVGPVFVHLANELGWVKLNQFSACETCRLKHVKCSLLDTGGPCDYCRKHGTTCEVHGWAFDHRAPARQIYKPALPPPPAAPPSPSTLPGPSRKRGEYEFDLQLLITKLTWLKEEAPEKLRKRQTAMGWKDSTDPTPERFPEDDRSSPPFTGKRRKGALLDISYTSGQSEPKHPSAPMRISNEQRASAFQSEPAQRSSHHIKMLSSLSSPRDEFEGSEVAEPESVSTHTRQHRMSIQFMLSESPSGHPTGDGKPRSDVDVVKDGWESRRTPMSTDSQLSWSARSSTRSPSLPPLEVIQKRVAYPFPPPPHRHPRSRIPSFRDVFEQNQVSTKLTEDKSYFSASKPDFENYTLAPLRQS